MIITVDVEKIIPYNLLNETINNTIFIKFIEKIISKIGKKCISKYLFIIDKAKCHIVKIVKKFYINNHLKILAKKTFYSIFNEIEYVFLNIK